MTWIMIYLFISTYVLLLLFKIRWKDKVVVWAEKTVSHKGDRFMGH